MKCAHCGWKNPATVTFCRKCGARLTDSSSSSTTFSSKELITVPKSSTLTREYREYEEYPANGRRRRIWPVIWLILVLLLLGGGGVAWWVINANQPANSVMQTMQTYCDALKSENYHLAYQQWSRGTQMSESDFTYTQKSKPKTTGCSVNAILVTNATAQASLNFVYAGGSSAVDQINLVLEKGVWKIKSQSLS